MWMTVYCRFSPLREEIHLCLTQSPKGGIKFCAQTESESELCKNITSRVQDRSLIRE